MKKVLAIVLAAVMVLCCSMTAFAEIYVDGDKIRTDQNADPTQTTETGVIVTISGYLETPPYVLAETSNNPQNVSVKANDGNFELEELDIHGSVTGLTGNDSVIASAENLAGQTQIIICVDGNVSAQENDNAVNVNHNGRVYISGNVSAENGDAIIADNKSKVEAKDVTGKVKASNGSDVRISGTLDSDYGMTIDTGAQVYIGQLKKSGPVTETNKNNVHYLIGPDSNDFLLVDNSNIIGATNGHLNSINIDGKYYYYTKTADDSSNGFGGKSFILRPLDDSKKLTVDGIPSDNTVKTKSNEDGSVEISLFTGFKGGLQNLNLTFEDIVLIVSFDSGGGSDVASQEVVKGKYATKPDDPTKQGSKFLYWVDKDGNVYDFGGTKVTDDITLKAIWEEIKKSSGSSGGATIFTGNKSNPVTNGKWTQNADGTWSYATTYKFTNEWACIAKPGEESTASWYYFDRNGNMLTGWQEIFWNGAKTWFYFIEAKGAEEGKCLINGITPDGYRVGPDGAWIEG